MDTNGGKTWRVGELAEATGLSVRALEPSPKGLIELIEGMTAMSRVLTREEFDQLTKSRLEATATLSRPSSR